MRVKFSFQNFELFVRIWGCGIIETIEISHWKFGIFELFSCNSLVIVILSLKPPLLDVNLPWVAAVNGEEKGIYTI